MEEYGIRMERDNIRNVWWRRFVWKKIFGIWLVLGMCVIGNCRYVHAEGYDYPIAKTKEVQELDSGSKDAQGVKYVLDESTHTAMVGDATQQIPSGYHGAGNGVCVIPEQVSQNNVVYTVTGIASKAFYNNSYLKTLVIADTVKKIDALALWGSYVQCLYIGSGMAQIVNEANMFAGCNYIMNITVSDENTVYKDCDGILFTKDGKKLLYAPKLLPGNSLTTYIVPDGVETIGSQAFYKTRYRRVVLPDSVKVIGVDAFENGYLTDVDLNKVEKISTNAFAGCKYLRYVKWSDATKLSIAGDLLFGSGDNNIQYMYLTKNLKYSNYDHSAELQLQNLKTLVVEEGTSVIGRGEFQYTQLETVILPEGIKKIEEAAFSHDPKLKKIYIPASVTTIEDKVLSGNDTVIYGVSGSAAETFAVENEMKFEDVSSHDHQTLSRVTVYEDSYHKVTADYCEECGYGTRIRQEDKEVTGTIDGTNGAYDFSLDKTKRKVMLDDQLQDDQGIVYKLYEDSDTAYVVRVEGSSDLKHVVIPEVVIYKGREYIVTTMFQSCITGGHVESVALPDTVWQIYEAFDSSSLKYVYLGEGVGNTAQNIFQNKTHITGIWVAPGNARYYVKDKALYYRDGTVLCDYSGNKESDKTTEGNSSETSSGGNKDTSTSEKNTEMEKTTEKDTSNSESTDEKSTAARTEHTTINEKTTEKLTERPDKTEITTGEKKAAKKKKTLKRPKLKVKKKKLSSGTHYLQLTLKQTEGTYIELQVKKNKKKYKSVKLVSKRLKYYKGKMRIGYKPDGKKMWLRIRTYKKKKGKKYYSDWSRPILIK